MFRELRTSDKFQKQRNLSIWSDLTTPHKRHVHARPQRFGEAGFRFGFVWWDGHFLDSLCQWRYTTSLNRAEDEQREIGCLEVIAAARDVHNETECDHDALLLMQSRRQACAAHDSVSVLKTEAEYIACARTERECVCVQLLGGSAT